jgi:hypothetical protein
MFKIWLFSCTVVIVCCLQPSGLGFARAQLESTAGHYQDEPNTDQAANTGGQFETLATSFPREALEKLANLTQEDATGTSNMWILVPSNLSGAQLSDSNFSLFKLNTGQLFDLGGNGQQAGHQDWVTSAGQTTSDASRGRQRRQQRSVEAAAKMVPTSRDARKLGLFSNVLNKPKVSPLYLINGTVCRFVNSQPICTTLSTTGLFRK